MNATATVGMDVLDAVAMYQRAWQGYELAKEARSACRNIAGLISPEALKEVERAARDAELEVNAVTSDNKIRPLLKQAMAAGISLK